MRRIDCQFLVLVLVLGRVLVASAVEPEVPLFGIFEQTFQHSGDYKNPYVEASATATLDGPDGSTRTIPLFWDGGSTWQFRFSPDLVGTWQWRTTSDNDGLGGKFGTFTVIPSDRKGSTRPMAAAPHHFERQDGTPFWFLGDTAWALYTDSQQEKHNRQTALEYVDQRAGQGFNVLHAPQRGRLG